jgi:hypothetical protein
MFLGVLALCWHFVGTLLAPRSRSSGLTRVARCLLTDLLRRIFLRKNRDSPSRGPSRLPRPACLGGTVAPVSHLPPNPPSHFGHFVSLRVCRATLGNLAGLTPPSLATLAPKAGITVESRCAWGASRNQFKIISIETRLRLEIENPPCSAPQGACAGEAVPRARPGRGERGLRGRGTRVGGYGGR